MKGKSSAITQTLNDGPHSHPRRGTMGTAGDWICCHMTWTEVLAPLFSTQVANRKLTKGGTQVGLQCEKQEPLQLF